ncbi:hypothetical protein J4423_03630 [Candidatus Pacearchaeota archaeon]|nr:hypothetical protein [Candidatus Pacearchaeota archaeon]
MPAYINQLGHAPYKLGTTKTVIIRLYESKDHRPTNCFGEAEFVTEEYRIYKDPRLPPTIEHRSTVSLGKFELNGPGDIKAARKAKIRMLEKGINVDSNVKFAVVHRNLDSPAPLDI